MKLSYWWVLDPSPWTVNRQELVSPRCKPIVTDYKQTSRVSVRTSWDIGATRLSLANRSESWLPIGRYISWQTLIPKLTSVVTCCVVYISTSCYLKLRVSHLLFSIGHICRIRCQVSLIANTNRVNYLKPATDLVTPGEAHYRQREQCSPRDTI